MVKMTCNLCKKPEEVKKEDAGWKTLCAPCFMKVRGKLTRCAACKIEFLLLVIQIQHVIAMIVV